MAGRKNAIKRFQTITDGDMSTASITSAVTNIEFLDNIGIQLQWSGSPVGSFAVQVSIDYDQDNNGNVISAGNWTSLPLSLPTSSGSPIYVDLNQVAAPWIRVVYTKSSGTGTLQAYISAKMI